MAKSKMMKLENIFWNKEIDVEMKMHFFRSDILSVLLHGVEYWNISDSNINMLEKFLRKSLLKIIGRSEKDGIRSTKLYNWFHKKGITTIYPIRFVMAERKLRYFAMIERGRKEELVRKMYWSDVEHTNEVKVGDDVFEHIKDIKLALEILGISEEVMMDIKASKPKWNKTLRESKVVAFQKWCKLKDRDYRREKYRKY